MILLCPNEWTIYVYCSVKSYLSQIKQSCSPIFFSTRSTLTITYSKAFGLTKNLNLGLYAANLSNLNCER